MTDQSVVLVGKLDLSWQCAIDPGQDNNILGCFTESITRRSRSDSFRPVVIHESADGRVHLDVSHSLQERN